MSGYQEGESSDWRRLGCVLRGPHAVDRPEGVGGGPAGHLPRHGHGGADGENPVEALGRREGCGKNEDGVQPLSASGSG